MEVAGPLGTPLGLAQRKRASPRGEAGTSGFLCVSQIAVKRRKAKSKGEKDRYTHLNAEFQSAEGSGAGGVQTAKAPRKQSSLSGKESAQVRKGTPLASRVAQGVSGPSSSCVWNPRVFADDASKRLPDWPLHSC